jgi:integrase
MAQKSTKAEKPLKMGMGTIRKRASKTRGIRYQAIFAFGYFADGSLNRPSETFSTLKEAQFWLSEQTLLHMKRAAPTQRPRFVSDLLDDYLKQQAQEHDDGNLRPRSLADYTRVAAKLRAVLPDVELDHLTTEHVKEALKSLEKKSPAGGRKVVTVGGKRKLGAPKKASAQEANRALRQLRRMLKFGQANGWVGKNVASLIKPVRRSTVKSGKDAVSATEKIWTLAEVQAFLTTALTHRQYAMLYLMLSYGPRVGEMMGLRWADLDLDQGRMKIARSYDPVYGLGPPKGGVARTVRIGPRAIEALRAHRLRQQREQAIAGERHTDLGLVFPTRLGSHTNHSNIRRLVDQLAERAGVTRLTVHGLRHTAASAMIQAGNDVVRVANILGHRDPNVTLRVYAHMFAERDNSAAQDAHTLYDLPPEPAVPASLPKPAKPAKKASKPAQRRQNRGGYAKSVTKAVKGQKS